MKGTKWSTATQTEEILFAVKVFPGLLSHSCGFVFSYSFLIHYILASFLSLYSSLFYLPPPPDPLFLRFPSEKSRSPNISAEHRIITSYKKTRHKLSSGGWGSPVGGRGPKSRQQSQRYPPLPLLGVPQNTQLHNRMHMQRP